MKMRKAGLAFLAAVVMFNSCSDDSLNPMASDSVDSQIETESRSGSYNRSAWYISNSSGSGGYTIGYIDSYGNSRLGSGSAYDIDVAPDGSAWVVNSLNNIYRSKGYSWEGMPGTAKAISVGADGSVWKIGTDVRSGGFGIYKYDAAKNTWNQTFLGGAVRIDVGPDGIPWVVNSLDQIFRYTNGSWVRKSGSAKDVGVGADGSVWKIGTNVRSGGYGIYKYNAARNTWSQLSSGGAIRIDVSANGTPWVVNSNKHLFKYVNGRWEKVNESANDIGLR